MKSCVLWNELGLRDSPSPELYDGLPFSHSREEAPGSSFTVDTLVTEEMSKSFLSYIYWTNTL